MRSFIQNVNVRKYWRKRRRKREKCTFRGLFYPLARTRDFLSEKRERERESMDFWMLVTSEGYEWMCRIHIRARAREREREKDSTLSLS